MVFTSLVQLLTDRIYATKKIRLTYNEVYARVERLMLDLMAFNTLEEDATWFCDRSTSEIEIPTDFVDFILPNSVRIREDRLYPDLLERGDKQFLQKVNKAMASKIVEVKSQDFQIADAIADLIEVDETDNQKTPEEVVLDKIRNHKFNYLQYLNNVTLIYQIFKTRPTYTALSTLRKNVLLTDVLDRIEVNGRLTAGSPVIPLCVNMSTKPFMGTSIQTVQTSVNLEKYIEKMFREY